MLGTLQFPGPTDKSILNNKWQFIGEWRNDTHTHTHTHTYIHRYTQIF